MRVALVEDPDLSIHSGPRYAMSIVMEQHALILQHKSTRVGSQNGFFCTLPHAAALSMRRIQNHTCCICRYCMDCIQSHHHNLLVDDAQCSWCESMCHVTQQGCDNNSDACWDTLCRDPVGMQLHEFCRRVARKMCNEPHQQHVQAEQSADACLLRAGLEFCSGAVKECLLWQLVDWRLPVSSHPPWWDPDASYTWLEAATFHTVLGGSCLHVHAVCLPQ